MAQWVQKNNKQAGATTRTLPNSRWLFLAVRSTRGALGVVGIPIAGYPQPDAFEKNFMVAILSECGLSMERWRPAAGRICPITDFRLPGCPRGRNLTGLYAALIYCGVP